MAIDSPITIDKQIVEMKKYVTFRKKVKIKRLLEYAGYFRVSRYGKYLLSLSSIIKSKPSQEMLFQVYDFDTKLRLLLFKYCKKAEIQFKSNLSNSISLKTSNPVFYLDSSVYTPSKSESDKTKRKNNKYKFPIFFADLSQKEEELRKNTLKYPSLKEYRSGGLRTSLKIPCWAAFSYFDFGTIAIMYSYLSGDLRKEVLRYGYSKKNYDKSTTKEVDTWLDAIRNLRNICAHHNKVIDTTSSVVLFSNSDTTCTGLNNTDLFSRLYALKKILPANDSLCLMNELDKLIVTSKFDAIRFGVLPNNWKTLYMSINEL